MNRRELESLADDAGRAVGVALGIVLLPPMLAVAVALLAILPVLWALGWVLDSARRAWRWMHD